MVKQSIVVALAVSLSILGTSAALAEEEADDSEQDVIETVQSEDYGSVKVFTDGRLNASDLAAPVAVYYTYAAQMVLDANGEIVWGADGYPYYEDVATGLQLLAIDSTGNGQAVLELSKDSINDALAQGQTSFVAGGYQLNINENGWYWLVSPPDADGKVYSFSWDDLNRTISTPVATLN